MHVIEATGIGDWVTTRHAADYFGVDQAAIERRIQRGHLVALVLGHSYLVRIADCLARDMRPVVGAEYLADGDQAGENARLTE